MGNCELQLTRGPLNANQLGVVVFELVLVLDPQEQLAKLLELFHSHRYELLLRLNQWRQLNLVAKMARAHSTAPLLNQRCNQGLSESFRCLQVRKYGLQLDLALLDQMRSQLGLVLAQHQKYLRKLRRHVRVTMLRIWRRQLVGACDQRRAPNDAKLPRKVCGDDLPAQSQLD